MTQQKQSTQDAVRAIYAYAGSLMKANVSDDEIRGKLTEKGVNAEAANVVIRNLHQAKRKVAQKDMLIGAGFCIVGLIITIATYTTAASSRGGGTYVIAWGAIIFGALQFFRGLARMR
jgi:hypothetical protein